MNSIQTFSINKKGYRSIFIDLLAVGFIYFVPTLSHFFQIPIYYAEPMRLMLIIAIAHTNRKNALILALTLPLFSFLVSFHPSLIKSGLITLELIINVWMFFVLNQFIRSTFTSMILAILISKAFYYVVKFLLISLAFINTSLISTPINIQIITTLLFSGYIYLIFRKIKQ